MITSTKNKLVTRIRRLRQKKYRLAEQVCFVEGLRLTGAASEFGADIETIVWCDALLTSDFGRNLLNTTTHPTIEVSEQVFQTISERDNPVGIAALVRFTKKQLNPRSLHEDSVVLALEAISDPGNLGTIMRTADAAGVHSIVLVGNCVDAYHPTALKASMGTVFNTTIYLAPDSATLLDFAKAADYAIVATTANADFDYRAFVPSGNIVLLMGTEQSGLSAETLAQADHTVSIPMRGTATSLNLAIATGLLVYQYTPETTLHS